MGNFLSTGKPSDKKQTFDSFGVGNGLGAFICVGWQVTLCNSIWQVTLYSSTIGFPFKKLCAPLTFNERRGRNAKINTASIFAFWSLRRLRQLWLLRNGLHIFFLRELRIFERFLRLLRKVLSGEIFFRHLHSLRSLLRTFSRTLRALCCMESRASAHLWWSSRSDWRVASLAWRVAWLAPVA